MYALVLVEFAPGLKFSVIEVVVLLELVIVGGDGKLVAVPVVCALPPAYPVLDVVTVTVADAPEPKPLTVNGYVLPEGEPKETEPELVDMPHV
jgi:hypothetical protein